MNAKMDSLMIATSLSCVSIIPEDINVSATRDTNVSRKTSHASKVCFSTLYTSGYIRDHKIRKYIKFVTLKTCNQFISSEVQSESNYVIIVVLAIAVIVVVIIACCCYCCCCCCGKRYVKYRFCYGYYHFPPSICCLLFFQLFLAYRNLTIDIKVIFFQLPAPEEKKPPIVRTRRQMKVWSLCCMALKSLLCQCHSEFQAILIHVYLYFLCV